jgi:antitoxin component YwqK of YwqJK toxin-antitoxin module
MGAFKNPLNFLLIKKNQHPYNGPHTVFFINRKKQSETNYKNGVQNGKTVIWYMNGQKAEEYTLRNGLVEGSYSRWYANGQIEEVYTKNNGKLVGENSCWHKNGQLWIKGNYISGKKDGFTTIWDKKGRVEENIYFVYGLRMFTIDHEMTEIEVLEDFKEILDKTNEKRFKKGYKELYEIRVDELRNKLGKG